MNCLVTFILIFSTLIHSITYAPFGPVASWTMGNGASYSRSFDPDGRVSSLTLPASDTVSLAYDPGSRISSIGESGLATKKYGYDPDDRLASYINGATTQTFGYDLSGNRISNVITGGSSPQSLTYNIDPASNRLLSITGTASQSFSYDAAGDTTASGPYAFYYDARRRMYESVQGSIVYDYALNGLGQRVGKTEVGGPPTTFVYDGAGRMIGRYNSTVTYEEHVYLGGLPVALLEPGGPYYVAPDHLGAPHQVTNGAGQVVWFWDHGAFGPAQPTGALVSFKDRFPGQFYDLETGLHYNGARDYDPTLGRYLESDPIGLAGGINTYAYAGSNPVSLSDPSGRILPLLALAFVGGGAALGAGGNYAYQLWQNPSSINYGDVAFFGLAGAITGGAAALLAAAAPTAAAVAGVGGACGAAERAAQIANTLGNTQRFVTIGVTDTAQGVRIISSSESALRPAALNALQSGEIAVTGAGHAEVTGVNAARDLGLTPIGTAASRPISPVCAQFLQDQGVTPLSPLK